MEMNRLGELRGRLDEVDRRIVEALRDRLDTVGEIAVLKEHGLPFLRDHEREGELLERVAEWSRELDIDVYRTQEVFREVLAMSLKAQEERLLRRERAHRSARSAHRVAFQGVAGAFSHIAARKYFAAASTEMDFVGCATFAEAVEMAESGAVGYAFLPIENTTAGSINQTYDLLRSTHMRIVGEELLHVRHCLMAVADIELESVRRVVSHPQALTQCSRFLASLRNAEAVAFADTAAAAQAVREADQMAWAAIASEEAAELHGLTIIARSIADQEENWTRFVVISSLEIQSDPRIPSKTSLVLTTRHRQGALARCLEVLEEHQLNLTKLESRPIPQRPWEYLFYVDFEGSLQSEPTQLAVAALRRQCPYLKVLGSYPARTTAAGAVDRSVRSADLKDP